VTELVGRAPAGLAPENADEVRLSASIESRASWVAASLTLALLSISYGSPLLAVVGLKPITEDLGTARQVVSLAVALTWLGTGAGGIVMGQVAERIGMRATVMIGAVSIAFGLALSATGSIWAILVGHTVFVGLFGNGALFPPLLVYVSRWFDRRRGTALALISSGQYIAGMAWPTVFEQAIAGYGWRATMLGFAAVILVTVPVARFLNSSTVLPQRGAGETATWNGTTVATPTGESIGSSVVVVGIGVSRLEASKFGSEYSRRSSMSPLK